MTELTSRSDLEEGPAAPTFMQVLGEDGEIYTEPLKLVANASLCCGCPLPLNPFAMLKVLAFVFAGLAVLAVAFAGYFAYQGDWFGFVGAVVLIAGGVLSALAAYSHEGLADQVTEMSRENTRFASSNRKLAEQVAELGHVEERLAEAESSMEGGMEELKGTLKELHQLTAASQLGAILRAFTDADSVMGDRNQKLHGDEVDEFFDSATPILEQAAPDFDFDVLQREAKTAGLDLNSINLLVNAVIAGSSDMPEKSAAELNLLNFSFQPEDRLEECQQSLYDVLKSVYSKDDVKALLESRMDEYEGEAIPCADLLDISREVMLSGQKQGRKRAVLRA